MERGIIIEKILETLQNSTEATINLFDIFMSGYGESRRKMWETLNRGPKKFKTDWAFEYRQRQYFYSILNKLKNHGLIEKKKTNLKSSLWKITKNGAEKLNLIKIQKDFSAKNINYIKEIDDKLKIVTFDIPEKERQKRDWLRAVLVALNFMMLQQSVWIGKSKLPEKLIFDLRERKMMSYVEIFEISKKGTIIRV